MSDIKIRTSAKTVENEKTKKQKEELEKSKQVKEEASKKAEEEQEKAKAAAEEAEREAQERKEAAEKEAAEKEAKENEAKAALAAGGASLAGALFTAAADGLKKTGKKKKKSSGKGSFWLGGLIGLLVGAGIMVLVGLLSKGALFGTTQTSVTTADEVLESGVIGFTAVDFQDAVMGEASRHQELIVMEQPLEISTTVTKAGLGGLMIFNKTKTITYYGTGIYTVAMAGLDKDHIKVDVDKKQVTITIPHACLQYVNPDLDKTEFEDTEKGLLAFGDIKLTTEDQNRLLQSVYQSMEERLIGEDLFKMADEFAQMSSWQMFQPLVTAISPEYTVEIAFDENTKNEVTASTDK